MDQMRKGTVPRRGRVSEGKQLYFCRARRPPEQCRSNYDKDCEHSPLQCRLPSHPAMIINSPIMMMAASAIVANISATTKRPASCSLSGEIADRSQTTVWPHSSPYPLLLRASVHCHVTDESEEESVHEIPQLTHDGAFEPARFAFLVHNND